VGVIVGIYFWHANYRDSAAEAALDRLTIPSAEEASASDAGGFLEVANLYPDTTAAARALLIAGQIQFQKGQFDQSLATFQRFMSAHHDYPLATCGLIGEAASLEAQGKTADATARYEEVLRHPQDQNFFQASVALGRLYASQGKAEQGLRELSGIIQTRQQNTWALEAQIVAQDILAKNPDLEKKLKEQQAQAQAQALPGAAPAIPNTTPDQLPAR